jgi:hypothetical protein
LLWVSRLEQPHYPLQRRPCPFIHVAGVAEIKL